MPSVTQTVIRLGNTSEDGIPVLDPNGINEAENAASIVGTPFTNATMSIETVTYNDANNDDRVSFDGAFGDSVSFDVGGGPITEAVDQAVWYDVDILLSNGSTLATSALIFQTASGETFLTEFSFISLDNLEIVSITPTFVNNSSLGNMTIQESVDNTTVCFGRGTQIMTPDGPRAVETFQPGDPVSTTDGTPQAVVAVYRTLTDPDTKGEAFDIAPHALGPDMPSAPLSLTGNHRVLCASKLVERMFDVPKILVPAKRFADLTGVTDVSGRGDRTFFHLELRQHSVVWANGALVESCLLGPMAAAGLPRIPALAYHFAEPTDPRFPVPSGARQRAFVRRLIKNARPVIEPEYSARDFAALTRNAQMGRWAA